MIASPMRRLERLSVVTLLGIRFCDSLTDRVIADGLRVTARLDGTPGPRIAAFRTLSGVYAFQGLPGMHGLEYPRVPPEPGESPPASWRFLVEVEDAEGQFVPVAFTVDLPLPYRGLLRVSSSSSPPLDTSCFYLFPSAQRPVPGGSAVVRADLVDTTTGAPATHAVLESTTPEGAVWRGLANARGQAALFLSYPAMPARLDGSPSVSTALSEQRWLLTTRVRYAPAHLRWPEASAVPDLRSILTQPYGTVWETEGGGVSGERLVELTFGESLVLRSEPGSALLVSAGP